MFSSSEAPCNHDLVFWFLSSTCCWKENTSVLAGRGDSLQHLLSLSPARFLLGYQSCGEQNVGGRWGESKDERERERERAYGSLLYTISKNCQKHRVISVPHGGWSRVVWDFERLGISIGWMCQYAVPNVLPWKENAMNAKHLCWILERFSFKVIVSSSFRQTCLKGQHYSLTFKETAQPDSTTELDPIKYVNEVNNIFSLHSVCAFLYLTNTLYFFSCLTNINRETWEVGCVCFLDVA